jgi:hypothetical protein
MGSMDKTLFFLKHGNDTLLNKAIDLESKRKELNGHKRKSQTPSQSSRNVRYQQDNQCYYSRSAVQSGNYQKNQRLGQQAHRYNQ